MNSYLPPSPEFNQEEITAIDKLWVEMNKPTTLCAYEWNDWCEARDKMLAKMKINK